MIDIKEKDIVINNYVPLTEDSKELTTIHINFEGNKKGAEQLKQQILQDHEDAKIHRKACNHEDFGHVTYCGICNDSMGKSIEHGVINTKSGKLTWLCLDCENQSKKDSQIVKRLEEAIPIFKEAKNKSKSITEHWGLELVQNQLQKILEGKK